MQKIWMLTALSLISSIVTSTAMADGKDWGNYKAVERPQPHKAPYTSSYKGYADPYGHPFTQEYPVVPQNNHRPPHYPSRPEYPAQNGVTIIYHQQLPTQLQSHHESHGFVNGQGGRIESSQYTLISDWRRYGLPDPQVGMHWIFQNGHYVQVANDR